MRGPEGDGGAALLDAVFLAGRADDAERRHRVPVGELDLVLLAIAPDAQQKFDRQGVDDRNADTMQATRHLVAVLVELTAGVELGHDDLGG